LGGIINKTFLWRGWKIGMSSESALIMYFRGLHRLSSVDNMFTQNSVENDEVCLLKMEDKIILVRLLKFTLGAITMIQ
jgi:hypothetical protein